MRLRVDPITKTWSRALKVVSRFTRQKRSLYVVFIIFLCLALFSLSFPYIFMFTSHLYELDYDTAFSWPLDANIKHCVRNLKTKKHSDCSVINSYDYSFISSCENLCQTESHNLILVYVVKSKFSHFGRRSAIRKSWGLESRFPGVRTVFLLGTEENASDQQKKIEEESNMYGDIVQANFIDTYWNNTVKTMMGMKWVVKHCSNSKFYCFSDDDMYVSTKNVLNFIKYPFNYPEYLEDTDAEISSKLNYDIVNNAAIPPSQNLSRALNFLLPNDVRLFAGHVCDQFLGRDYRSKRYISLSEYPFHRIPRYIPAGCYVLSFNALSDLYFGSFFTKHFRVDDVYLGIIAKKMHLKLFHCEEFHFIRKPYNVFDYRYVIASHGYSDPDELLKVWNEQRSAGNA